MVSVRTKRERGGGGRVCEEGCQVIQQSIMGNVVFGRNKEKGEQERGGERDTGERREGGGREGGREDGNRRQLWEAVLTLEKC